MRNAVFAINMTADGYFGHEDMIADEELHQYFAELLRGASVILFGRKTYQLMESYWPEVAKNQSETPATNEFARAIDSIDKIVFSKTLNSVTWNNTEICRTNLEEEVRKLKQQHGKNICVGSLSIASQLSQSGLIDEYHIVIHPIVVGKGPRLFEADGLKERLQLELTGSKKFHSGVIALHYKKRSP